MTLTSDSETLEAHNLTSSPVRWVDRMRDRHTLEVLWITVGASVALAILLAGRIAAPPFWDASWSTFAGAVELSRNGFDYLALLSARGFIEGGPGTHSASLLTPIQGVLFSVFGSPGGLVASHVLMFVMGGALTGATYALGRRYVPRYLALMAAVLVMVLPVTLQQIADPYVEVPLAFFTVLTAISVVEGSRTRTALFAAFAIWIKATGLMLVPLVGLMGNQNDRRRWFKNSIAVAAAFTPFALRLISPSSLLAKDTTTTLQGTLILLRSAVIALGSMIEVVVIFALFILGSWRLRRSHPDLVRIAFIVTLGFFAIVLYAIVSSQGVTILPRYYVAVLPLWVIVMAVHLSSSHSRRIAAVLLALFTTFALVNWNGSLHLISDHSHPVMAERSVGGGDEYLNLEIRGTRALAETADSVELLLLSRELDFRMLYPELGFVDDTPSNVASMSEVEDLPSSFAILDEPHGPDGYGRLIDRVVEDGWTVERTSITQGRWTSELVIARNPDQ